MPRPHFNLQIGSSVLRLLAALSLVSALAMLHMASADGTSQRPSLRCPPRHVRVLRGDAQAVLYATGSREERAVEGCVHGASRAYRVGEPTYCADGSVGFCTGITRLTLSGTMVGYEEGGVSEVGEQFIGAEYVIAVRSLRTGRIIHRAPTGVIRTPRRGFTGVGPATALVVGVDGSVAWIVDNYEQSKPGLSYYEVRTIDSHGSRLLDSGSTIQRSSLKLRGDTLSWLQAGERRTAVVG